MSEDQSKITNQAASQSAVTAAKSSVLKELWIPISIVIAGAFIGAGLFFSGESGTPEQLVADVNPTTPEEPIDTTAQIDPVTEDDYIKGSVDAPITIVEYSDFDCPFCSRFHDSMNQVVANSDVEVAWVYRHFPLEQLHPNAFSVSLAAECVGEQGGDTAFWQFTDAYFAERGAGNNTPHGELVPQLVLNTGVDRNTFTECFESGRYNEDIQADIENALETGGRGTPWSILIGPTGNTYPINGAQPARVIEQIIQAALAEA